MNELSRLYEAQHRHAVHYGQVLKKTNDLYRAGRESGIWALAVLDSEAANITLAQTWTASNTDTHEDAARLSVDFVNNGAAILISRLHPRQSALLFQKAAETAHKLKYHEAEYLALGNLGNAYRYLGEYERALQPYKRALRITRKIGARKAEGVRLGNLGLTYRHLREYKRALKCFEKALAIARDLGDKWNENAELVGLGNVYFL
jgi:tetratricopeptide (TPR) repeat protein